MVVRGFDAAGMSKAMQKDRRYFLTWNLIRTGATCKKIPCYMRHSGCRWFIVKKAKIL